MRVAWSWLSQHVDLTGISVEALSERLTTSGIEVESVDYTGGWHPDVVVGCIRTIEEVEGGLRWMWVDAGLPEPLRVASRAPNMAAAGTGTFLAFARPGAVVFEQKDGEVRARKVTSAKLKSGVSEGVGCSSFELGIGLDHSGVLLLDGPGASELPDGLQRTGTELRPGLPLSQALDLSRAPLADRALVLAILPNIARCQSVLGVAREVGALLERPVSLQPKLAEEAVASGGVDPFCADVGLCDRFGTLLLEGVVVGPSPTWIQNRLLASGLSPINNVVDATNLCMWESGQPTHAYDADHLPDLRLVVRRAGAGESFKPLTAGDGDAPGVVPEGCPLVVSGELPVALAGVMGGFDARVRPETHRVLLESAHFDFISVRKSQQANLIFSDSSARFSRGVDPALVEVALRRIVALLRESCPELKVVDRGLFAPVAHAPRQIHLGLSEVVRALGVGLEREEISAALDRLGLGCSWSGEVATVLVPTARQDLERGADLLEEIARIVGFDRLPATMPVEPIPAHTADPRLAWRAALADQAVAAGLQEVMTYSLSSPELEDRLWAGRGQPPERRWARVVNPISVERRVMRRTLLAHLLDVAAWNHRHTDSVHVFELGVVVHAECSGVDRELPWEGQRLGLLLSGPIQEGGLHEPRPRMADIHDLQSVLEQLLHHLHVVGVRVEPVDRAPLHPGVGARLIVDGSEGPVELGIFGQVHPKVAAAFDLAGRTLLVAELDADVLASLGRRFFDAPGPPRFPEVSLDIAVVADEVVPAGALVGTVRKAGGSLIREVTVFDVYRGQPMAAGQKAVGLRLRLGADRTLEMREAEALRDAVVAALGREHAAVLRS